MTKTRLPIALLAVLAAIAASPVHATVFGRGGPLFTIETKHFAFVFPEARRADAEHLASAAEGIYAEVTAFVGTDPEIRVTVLVSDDSQYLQGYADNTTCDRIVLYPAPSPIATETGSLADTLLDVFRHELAHAVSLNVKSGFWAFWEAVFGDMVAPNFWWMQGGEFTEGVTVAAESDGGGGRANDPLVLLSVRQDILEGKARTAQEARGGDDRWPGGSIHYWYGGVFTVWLRETYGAQKYGELWREFGNGNALVGSDGFLFLAGAFQTVYGRPLDAVWDEFLRDAAYRRPVITAVRRLRGEPGRIYAATASGGDLYWGDSAAGALFRRDGKTGSTRALKTENFLLSAISARPGSTRLLLSEGRYVNLGSAFRVFVRAWDESTGSYSGPEWPDLREAQWMQGTEDAFAAIAVRGSFADLVLVRDGRRETLLEGTYERECASPAPLADGRIAFLLKEKGTIRIARIDPAAKSLEVLETVRPLGIVRGLSASGNDLAFSWATKEDFPSLGLLDSTGLHLQKVAISGGVSSPLAAEGGIYYIGRFSDGMRPCSYPKDLPDLALEAADCRWVAHGSQEKTAGSPALPSRPYAGLTALIPGLRFPFPKIGTSAIEGAGLYLLSYDPGESWALLTAADYDWTRTFADVSLTLELMPSSTVLTLAVSDAAAWSSVESRSVRTLSGSLAGTFYDVLSPESATLSLGASAGFTARAPEVTGASTAYAWPITACYGSAGVVASYNGRVRRSLDPAARKTGMAASLSVDGAAPIEAAFLPGIAAQANLAVSVGILGLDVDAWAAATPPGVAGLATLGLYPAGIYRQGATGSGISNRYPSFREYASFAPAYADSWFYGCVDANWMPLEADVMRDVRDLKVFVTRLGASAGYRGALAGMNWIDAAYVRLHVQGGPDQGTLAGTNLTVYGELSYALRASTAGVSAWSLGFGLTTGM